MTPPRLIELNLRDVGQLFNTMDPSPFDEKDLDQDAEEFISGWAWEHPRDEPIALRVHLERWPSDDPTELIRAAVHHHFANRENMAALKFRRLMRRGRTSLLVGLVFLGVCLLVSSLVPAGLAGVGPYLREGLSIVGWVAMWRPLEIYLYEWWPLRDERRLFARLSEMPIEVVRSSKS